VQRFSFSPRYELLNRDAMRASVIITDKQLQLARIKRMIYPIIPLKSYDCSGDRVNIQYDGRYMNSYCGQGKFITEGINATVTLNTRSNTSGGVFLCEATAIYEDNCQCGWKNPVSLIFPRSAIYYILISMCLSFFDKATLPTPIV